MRDGNANPKAEVSKKNAWYTDDQMGIQMGNAGLREVVKGRWLVFEQAIKSWLEQTGKNISELRFLDAGCGDGVNVLGLSMIF
ncbi:MAG: hypothetical protein OEV92_00545 [Nitrospinota bacterium]|nr:hypothetical protein [Nitrospinota bacterium]